MFLRETSTLGVRVHKIDRTALDRRVVEVPTDYGTVRLKVAQWNGEILKVKPEYEDCRAHAIGSGVTMQVVRDAALDAYQALHGNAKGDTPNDR